MTKRNGDWIQTFTGRQFWPMDPRAEEISIDDIAHSLALQCRFTGHTRDFFSVAQHSLLCSYNCPEFALTALLHDAAEAYLVDVARPVKPYLKGYREAEDLIMKAIAARFRIRWPLPDEVIEADRRSLATEKRDLLGPEPADWGPMLEPWPEPILPLAWYQAKAAFLRRFEELNG